MDDSKRFASCSSDRSIKVWDLVEGVDVGVSYKDQHLQQQNKTRWMSCEIAKPHSGSIWRISWAHPEFGQVSIA